jgi:hypothetical protein
MVIIILVANRDDLSTILLLLPTKPPDNDVSPRTFAINILQDGTDMFLAFATEEHTLSERRIIDE